MLKLLIAGVAAALVSTAALAEEKVPLGAAALVEAGKPPTPAARAETARLISQANAADLFEDASKGELPGVRHLRSGLVCTFEPGSPDNRIHIFPSSMPRGDDVGCNTSAMGIRSTLYATRFPPELTPQELMQGTVQAIYQQFPKAKPFKGTSANAQMDAKPGQQPLPEHLRARLLIKIDGKEQMTKVDLARVGEWTIKMRSTGPKDMSMDLMSELTFIMTLQELTNPEAAPATP